MLLSHPTENPVEVFEVPPGELPLSVLTHLYPSRYCQSDRLERFAQRAFGELPTGYQRVAAVCNWIRDNVDYVSGASDALTSAYDIVVQRAGVCRDFAHLGIAFCRALGVPARYVSAYAWRLEPPDFHGIFEAFLRGPAGFGWYTFDPTRMADPRGIVRIGVGRDAAGSDVVLYKCDIARNAGSCAFGPWIGNDEGIGRQSHRWSMRGRVHPQSGRIILIGVGLGAY